MSKVFDPVILGNSLIGDSLKRLLAEPPPPLSDEQIDEICRSIVEHGTDGPEKIHILPLIGGHAVFWYEEF